MPILVPNSGEVVAPNEPVSNCRYPSGVNEAGVETVGRAGFASGTGSVVWAGSEGTQNKIAPYRHIPTAVKRHRAWATAAAADGSSSNKILTVRFSVKH